MEITFTQKASVKLLSCFDSKIDASSQKGVRLSATNDSCRGFEYKLKLVDSPSPDDIIYQQNNLNIYLDSNSASYLNGLVVDFVEAGSVSGFTFDNPAAPETCGCGKPVSSGCPK